MKCCCCALFSLCLICVVLFGFRLSHNCRVSLQLFDSMRHCVPVVFVLHCVCGVYVVFGCNIVCVNVFVCLDVVGLLF